MAGRMCLVAAACLVPLGGWAEAGAPDRDLWTSAYDAPTPSPAEVRSLDEALTLAERRNPGLRAAFDRWSAKREAVPQATALPDPKLSYGYFVESVETRVGPQRQKIGLSQTIPLFKLGLRGDLATSDAAAAGADFEAMRLEVRTRVSRLWADYAYLRRAIEITEENVDLVAHMESVALAQYAAGIAPHAAVIRSQVELGKLEDRLRTLRDRRHALVAALNAELDRAPDAPIAWPETVSGSPVDIVESELRASLLESNPALASARLRVARDITRVKLAGKGPIPDLTLGAELIDTAESDLPNVVDSGKNAAVAKATVNLPLWFGRYRAEKRQATARRSASELEARQVQNRLSAELSRAVIDFRDAERRIELYRDTLLPKARQSVEATEKSFVAGNAGFLDLVDAQRTLLEFQLSHERAVADRAATVAYLDQLVGGTLSRGGR